MRSQDGSGGKYWPFIGANVSSLVFMCRPSSSAMYGMPYYVEPVLSAIQRVQSFRQHNHKSPVRHEACTEARTQTTTAVGWPVQKKCGTTAQHGTTRHCKSDILLRHKRLCNSSNTAKLKPRHAVESSGALAYRHRRLVATRSRAMPQSFS